MLKLTTRNCSEAIRRQADFKTSGALRGSATRDSYGLRVGSYGRLLPDFGDSYRRATYVVWSYDTPIAWVTDGKWVKPALKYSPTTSRHQGVCPADGTIA